MLKNLPEYSEYTHFIKGSRLLVKVGCLQVKSGFLNPYIAGISQVR